MIGDLISAFSGSPHYTPQYSSEPLHQLADKLTGQLSTNVDSAQGDLSNYNSALKDQQGAMNDAVSRYTDLAKSIQGRTATPLDNYKSLGDYLFSKVNTQATDPVINSLANQTALHNKVLGVNPGVDSTYDRLMRAGVASKVRLSALSDIVNQLNPTAASLNNQQLQNDQFSLGLAPQELGLRNSLAAQNLLPLYARNSSLGDIINNSNAVNQLNQGNIYGYTKDRTGLDRWSDAFNALKNGAWEGLSFYSSLMGGGAGGRGGAGGGGMGGMGGMMGGGGGGGGMGGGSGGNMGALLQMFRNPNQGAGYAPQGYGYPPPQYGGGYFDPQQYQQGYDALNGSYSPYYNYNYAPMGGYGTM